MCKISQQSCNSTGACGEAAPRKMPHGCSKPGSCDETETVNGECKKEKEHKILITRATQSVNAKCRKEKEHTILITRAL